MSKIIDQIFDFPAIKKYRVEEQIIAGTGTSFKSEGMFLGTEITDLEEELCSLISANFPNIPLNEINLVDQRHIDSLTILSLSTLIGERFAIELTYNEISPENFNSVHSMALLVSKLLSNRNSETDPEETSSTEKTPAAPAICLNSTEKDKTAVQRVLEQAEQQPEAIAIIAEDVQTTYKQLAIHIFSYVDYLKGHRVKAGDRVVLRATSNEQFVASFLAIQLIGAVAVPFENAIGKERIAEIADDSQASLVLDYQDLEQNARPSEPPIYDYPTLDMPCVLLYTTGSTGRSKGGLISHSCLSWYCYAAPQDEQWRINTRLLTPMPLNHIVGCYATIATLTMGSTAVLIDGMKDVGKAFRYIQQYRCNKLLMTPSALQILVHSGKEKIKALASQIYDISFAAEPMPFASIQEYRKLLPNTRLGNIYGSTETGHATYFDCNQDLNEIPLGYPYRGVTIGIKGDDGIIRTGKNLKGRVCIKGEMMMLGYFNNPELTESIYEGEWQIMGDMGYVDDDGVLYFRGRAGDVINIGGLKISPIEVEGVAIDSGTVNECICYEAKDAKGLPFLRLLVVPRNPESFNSKSLQQFLSTHLEAYRVPKQIDVVDAIARTWNGKIDRKVYRDPNFTVTKSTKEPEKRHGTRNLILGVAANLLLLFILAFGTEYMLRHYPGTYSYKAQWMKEHAEEVETLILGPSPTYYGVRPDMLHSKAFNLANAGQTSRFDWLMIENDSLRFTNLKTIILPAVILRHNFVMETTNAAHHCAYYRIHFGCPDHGIFSIYSYEIGSPEYAKKKLQKIFSGESELTCDSLGCANNNINRDTRRWVRPTQTFENRISPIDYNALVFEYCIRHGIRIIMPNVPQELVEPEEEEAQRKEVEKYLAKYKCIEYIDYNHDPRFTNEDFYDGRHLNTRGAEKFTNIIINDFGL